AGARRDQAADDDVFLQAFQRVLLAVDGSLGQDAGGLLERGRRDEAAGLQRRLGDAQQDRLHGGDAAAALLDLGVLDVDFDAVDVVALDQRRFSRVDDFDLLQHLTDDDLDVLVVDRHALQSVDLLHFVHQIFGQRLDALDAQQVVRIRVAVDDVVALLDQIAVVDGDVLALGDQELDRFALVAVGIRLRGDLDAALVLVVATEFDATVHLGDDRAVLRTTGFEQFGHARQTAGDVPGLCAFGRDTRDDVARLDLVAVGHRQDGADGQQIARVRTARQLGVAVALGDAHGRTQVR